MVVKSFSLLCGRCVLTTQHNIIIYKPASFRSLLPRPDVATVLHFASFMDVDVQLQDGQAAARGQRRKAVIRDIPVLITEA